MGRFNWTISLCGGFLCSITTKIHQMELRGFNAGNCGAKRSVIGLSNESGEKAIENEASLALNSTRVMAQACSRQPAVLRTPVPNPHPPAASIGLPGGSLRPLSPCLCWGAGMGWEAVGMLARSCRSISSLVTLGTSGLQTREARRPPWGGLLFSPSDVDNLLPPGLCSGPWSLCLDSTPRLPTLGDFSFYRWSGAFLTFPR